MWDVVENQLRVDGSTRRLRKFLHENSKLGGCGKTVDGRTVDLKIGESLCVNRDPPNHNVAAVRGFRLWQRLNQRLKHLKVDHGAYFCGEIWTIGAGSSTLTYLIVYYRDHICYKDTSDRLRLSNTTPMAIYSSQPLRIKFQVFGDPKMGSVLELSMDTRVLSGIWMSIDSPIICWLLLLTRK